MNKKLKLKICDWALLVTTILMLASGIELEATGSQGNAWIWLHTAIGAVFFADIIWHIYLHFQWKQWIRRFSGQKSPVTRWLAIIGALTLISGIAALAHWASIRLHSPIGGIHGKIGFLFMLLGIGHICKRLKFFRKSANTGRIRNRDNA